MTAVAAVVYIVTLVLVLIGFAVLLMSAWWEFCIRLKRERSTTTPPPWPKNPGWVESVKENER